MKRQIGRLLVVAGILLVVGATATAGWALHRGYRIYSVRTGSMEPAYHVGDAVVVGPSNRTLSAGDVVTFRPPGSPITVTHRVVSTDGASVTTKGDANSSVDTWQLDTSSIKGRVVERLPSFGYVLIYFQQPTGVASLMMFGLATTMLWQIFFTSPARPARAMRRRRDPSMSWSQLAETLEATTASILAVRAPGILLASAEVEELPDRYEGDTGPTIPIAWSEATVHDIEMLCVQLDGAANASPVG